MKKNKIYFVLITFSLLFFTFSGIGQEKSTNRLHFRGTLCAQTPFVIPNGFYNKNYQTTNYFRSGYGLGVDYKMNNKWHFSGSVAYYQSFVQQYFYFGGFGDDADFNFKHISPEIGLNVGINRTLVASEKGRLSWSLELQPWMNLSKEIKSTTRKIPDGLGGKRDSQVTIRPSDKLNLAGQSGLRYDYFGKHLNYGFAIDLHLRQSGIHPFELIVEDWFSYSSSYTSTAAMLSFSVFIGY